MSRSYNIYCDESCHLENDEQTIMAFGAVWCPKEEAKNVAIKMRKIKSSFNANGELKWTKVSSSREKFYLDLVKWFFKEKDIHFRALIVNNKERLDHEAFNQGSHDTFYYKMYFSLLNKILDPRFRYNIYLDVKDTRSYLRIQKLRAVLCNNIHDFTHEMIHKIQSMHSHEFELMQLADFLLGAVAYKNRNLSSNEAKIAVVKKIENKAGFPINYSSSLKEDKFNLFVFSPKIEK